jgi:hypothetical protein
MKFHLLLLSIFISQFVVSILLLLGNLDIHSDVHVRKPKDRELLIFDEYSKNWVNRSSREAGLVEVGHTHVLSEITDLITTTELPEGDNLYYTESSVVENPSVANNTTKVSADGPVSTHSDLDVVDVANNELMSYDASSGMWINRTTSELGLQEVGVHTHFLSEITDLITTTDLPEGDNLYYTEARVEGNPAVVANTAKVSADESINTHIDVDTTDVADNDLLSYDTVSGKWICKSIVELNLEVKDHSHTIYTRNLLEQTSPFTSENKASGNYYSMVGNYIGNQSVMENRLIPGSRIVVRSTGRITKDASTDVSFRVLGYETPFLSTGFVVETPIAYDLTITFAVQLSLLNSTDNKTDVFTRFQVANLDPSFHRDTVGIQINTTNIIDLQYQPNATGLTILQSQLSICHQN